jgi:hypothetical protein
VSGPNSSRLSPEARARAIGALCRTLDAQLVAAGYAVAAAATAPPPPAPALAFEAWVEVSVLVLGSPDSAKLPVLAARGITLETWKKLDLEYHGLLAREVGAGGSPRTAHYEARLKEEMARRRGAPVGSTPVARAVPEVASAALRATFDAPEFVAETWEVIGRMPFVPAAPAAAPAAGGKGSAKTEKSMPAVPSETGRTLRLDAADLVERPTPSLPFAGTPRGDGVLALPERTAMELVALTLELWLKAAPLEEALLRYRVPNEAGYRALVALHREPGRREQVAGAIDDLADALRKALLA